MNIQEIKSKFKDPVKNEAGNGRFVCNVLENARLNQAQRLVSLNTEFTSAELLTLLPENIDASLSARKNNDRIIGFAC